MGITSSVADPDVWLHPAVKANGEQYMNIQYVESSKDYIKLDITNIDG